MSYPFCILRSTKKPNSNKDRMKKEKFHIEYIFDKVSNRSLWNHLTTALGLSSWFADTVDIRGNIYTFTWKKMQEQAEIIEIKPEVSVRYRWLEEEDENAYFDLRRLRLPILQSRTKRRMPLICGIRRWKYSNGR